MTEQTVTITLNEMTHHCLSQLAENEFRTIDKMIEILMYMGIQSYQFDRELIVQKKPEHRNPEGTPYQYYDADQIVEYFKPEIKWLKP